MPTKSPYPDVTIPQVDLWSFMFQRKRDFPDSQVIYRSLDSKRQYTFSDVRAAATAFGEGLCNLWDWQKGEVLAIYAPNDVDFGPVVYGAFFAGAVVSPANPAYSPDELAFQLSNSGAKALVTTKSLLPIAEKAAAKADVPADRIILLGEQKDNTHRVKHWSNIRKTSGALRYRRRKLNPENDLALLVYSSGTTGLPKGVMLSHLNLVADLCLIEGSVGSSYSSARHDKMLGLLPFFHIYGLTGLVLQALHRGIELVAMPAFELRAFLAAVQSHRITLVYVAPPVVVRLARADRALLDAYDLSSLRMMTSGAAPLTPELVAAVNARLAIPINQAYGLSETSSMTHTQAWDEWQSSVGSVGKMFPNMTAKYVDPDGSELPPNQPGELWLAGPQVFGGYWKNPAATADAVVHSTDDGLRYFKTGDVGFQDENHNFHITDRVKELIKYNGFQVAPAELEGKLMDNDLVDDVAVVGVQDAELHTEVPRAYVVRREKEKKKKKKKGDGSGRDVEAEEAVMRWLDARVANHKRLRGGVRFVDEIPKSASGKILRRVLKEQAKKEETRPKL